MVYTNTNKQPLVLVVDDEVEILGEVATVLAGAGYVCQCCNNAEDALRFAEANTPDLILSDINLGGHSGLRMCEELKKQSHLRDVPVMFLSGAQIPDIIRRSHAVGGAYYLRKPFDPEVLLELVDKALWMPHLVRSHEQVAEAALHATN
ncbi:MAG: response regulator [Pirellulaceae bacterium]|nr:response regulator [Pirellulaceae bacterium]